MQFHEDKNKQEVHARKIARPSRGHSVSPAIPAHKWRRFYSRLPINFSTFTGLRHPGIPRLRGNPILGRLPYLLQKNGILNNLIEAGKLAEQHSSGMCYYWLGPKPILVITKPEHVHQLLIDHHNDLYRGVSFTIFKKFMGPNITVDPPAIWKTKKDVYSDWLYKTSILAEHEPKMIALVNKYVSYLEAQKGQLLNLREIFNSYALEVILSTTLLPEGYSPENVEKFLGYHAYVTREIFEYRNIFKWLLPSPLRRLVYREPPEKSEAVCQEMRDRLNDIFLCPHEEEIRKGNNFVHSIYNLTPHQPNDSLISDPNVFGDTSMMLLAGQDTNLATFQFTVKLLSAHPEVEEKLRQELQENLKGQDFTVENVHKIQYLDMVVKEAMRMFPPVLFLPRDVAKPFTLGEAHLKKGDIVIFAPYLTHHLESVWEDHHLFKPERFDKHNKVPPQAYLPFGAGTHMCIGQRFAWQEIKLLLAAIYLNHTIKVEDNDFEISLEQGALKPKTVPMARVIPV